MVVFGENVGLLKVAAEASVESRQLPGEWAFVQPIWGPWPTPYRKRYDAGICDVLIVALVHGDAACSLSFGSKTIATNNSSTCCSSIIACFLMHSSSYFVARECRPKASRCHSLPPSP